jgi:hypothetical protein
LQENGYLVLETQNTLKALVIAIRHSRSIHLLLADDSEDSRDFAATLKPYRPEMKVIHIGPNLEPDLILMEVSKILDPPVQAFENNESSGTNLRAGTHSESGRGATPVFGGFAEFSGGYKGCVFRGAPPGQWYADSRSG